MLRSRGLDVHVLDAELLGLLHRDVEDALKMFPLLETAERFKPEVDLCTRALYFVGLAAAFATGAGGNCNTSDGGGGSKIERPWRGSTAGMRMEGLQYRRMGRVQSVCMLAVEVLMPWALQRLRRYGLSHGWADAARSATPTSSSSTASSPSSSSATSAAAASSLVVMGGWVWRALDVAGTTMRALSLINLIWFLMEGRYPTLLERVLQVDMETQSTSVARQQNPTPPNFANLNRQLVWQHVTRFLLIAAPLIDWGVMSSFISNGVGLFRATPETSTTASTTRSSQRPRPSDWHGVSAQDACVVCAAAPAHTPVVTRCCHAVTCFICMQSALAASGGEGANASAGSTAADEFDHGHQTCEQAQACPLCGYYSDDSSRSARATCCWKRLENVIDDR